MVWAAGVVWVRVWVGRGECQYFQMGTSAADVRTSQLVGVGAGVGWSEVG